SGGSARLRPARSPSPCSTWSTGSTARSRDSPPAPEAGRSAVLVVHGTKKFLDRAGRPTVEPGEPSTAQLGSWYATVLFWKPQVALFVNETTLLPLLMPFAPAATVLARFPAALERVLAAHGVDPR